MYRKYLLVFFAVIIFYISFSARQNSIKNISLPLAANTALIYPEIKIGSGLPVRMKIPSLKIDTHIESAGLTKEGAVAVPKGPDNVVWFDLGPRPGEIGSSVINGHSGYKDNKPAVFDNLDKLRKGDKIYVEDEFGAATVFVVREFETYNSKANPAEVFSSNDGASHLNLVTCTGNWNEAERTHSNRLVVFTDKE